MMKYELMLIVSPKLTDKEIEKTLNEIKGTLAENKAEVVAEDVWGKRDMAYKIKGQRAGYYVVLNFEAETAGIPGIHKDLRIQAGLLRYLLISVPESYRLVRYEEVIATPKASARNLTTRHAEELTKKVTKRTTKKDEEAPEKDEKLDEKLSAIVNNADLDI